MSAAAVLAGEARWCVEQGDCLDVLRGLRVDAVITDAPFGIKDAAMRMGPMGGTRRGDNTYHPLSDWDSAIDPAWCRAACEAAPLVAWFGSWRKRAEVEAAMPHPIRCEIVWAKDMHVGPPCPASMRDERIWIFSSQGVRPRRHETTVWDEPVIPTWAHKYHKNEKPLALMRRLVSWLVAPGQVICDPFCGSGTTLVAAAQLGVRSIGCDISGDHVAIARAKLAAEERGLSLAAATAGQTSIFDRVKVPA